MIVLKFGGTSVATADSLRQVKSILKKTSKSDSLVVVVSALGGITNKLQETAQKASLGDENYLQLLKEIEKRHLDLCTELLDHKNRNQILTNVRLLLNDLEDLCRGVYLINELSARSLDQILSYGEILSAQIISHFLQSEGQQARFADSRSFIKTDDRFGKAAVDQSTTYTEIQNKFRNHDGITICPGFVASSNASGITTTLGRGGSDYTAALIAAALKVQELQIWTDVSGMMTSDPRLVPEAHPIEHISYEEAMELSHFGAKVIYPPTIQPVMDAGIPVLIKNTFAPENPGTRISRKGSENGNVVKGTSSIEEVALCTLTGSGMIAVPNISARLFGALSRYEINVIMITQASSEHSITVGIANTDTKRAEQAINEEFTYEIENRKVNPLDIETDLSIVALVGSRMKQQVGVSARLFETLSHNGVNIRAIAQGSTELNISVVIAKRHLKKSLNSIHESFFLADRKKLNLFMIGAGNVGKAFLQQIKSQQQYLEDKHHLQVSVTGLANSRKMIFDAEGIDLETWDDQFDQHSEPMDADQFIHKMIDLNLRNSVFIDSTASEAIASLYEKVLTHSISVVTPNKVACSSSYQKFKKLRETALKYQAKFLYETNVGAGLPVISTLNDLLKSGDQIHKIQAVLSGTLNFLFNHYDGERLFSEIVKQAKEEGYTEPDPRLDLSGKDVMRKILILARVSGYSLEMKDITNKPFIPEYCMESDSLEEFYGKLDEKEEHFKKMFESSESKGERLKYVATFEDGKAQTGLESFGPDHPFYNLGGKDNIVLFYTNRYSEQPLVVKGAGAGAAVTASGIFADIMKIASA